MTPRYEFRIYIGNGEVWRREGEDAIAFPRTKIEEFLNKMGQDGWAVASFLSTSVDGILILQRQDPRTL